MGNAEKILLVLALIGILLLSASFYPQAFVVYEIDRENDLVTVESATGMLYAFYGVSDYEVGDIVSCIMFNGFTGKTVLDDAIVSARYTGFWME